MAMAEHEAQRVMRACTAIGAFLFSGTMLFVGPVNIAAADPNDEMIPLPPVENVLGPAPDLGDMSQTESFEIQQLMDRNATLENLVANLLKARSDASSAIDCNVK